MKKSAYTCTAISMILYLLIGAFSCQSNVSIETAQYAVNGQKLYVTHCQNCHGTKGEGLGNLYPPLTDTAFLNQNRNNLPCYLKHGLQGPIKVAGKIYDTEMPGVPELTPVDIAYILTYVTTTFGNSTITFTQEDVKNSLKDCL